MGASTKYHKFICFAVLIMMPSFLLSGCRSPYAPKDSGNNLYDTNDLGGNGSDTPEFQFNTDNDKKTDVNNDADDDGIEDSKDNCPNHANRFQEDYNHNGIGDVCELANTPREKFEDPEFVKSVCKEHLHWWKVDDYLKWRKNPDCSLVVDNNPASEADYRTIQEAVDVSVPGDVICIKKGIYQEHYFDTVQDKAADPTGAKCKFAFCDTDDFVGLYIDKKATPDKPIVIAAVEDGVILDGNYANDPSHSIDVGIFINNGRYDQGFAKFEDQPQFIEIYGLTIQNYKLDGIDMRGSCIKLSNSIVRYNARVIPKVDANAFWSIIADYMFDDDGNILIENGMPKKYVCEKYPSTPNVSPMMCDVDNDGDGIYSELDENSEKANIGRDAIYEANGTWGNIFTENNIYDNGWYHKLDCGKPDDDCPLTFEKEDYWCRNVPIDYASPTILSCNEARLLFPDIGEVELSATKAYPYACLKDGVTAVVSFPNKMVADRILNMSEKDSGELQAIKSKILKNALSHSTGSGHGLYMHGSAKLVMLNAIHDNEGDGLSVRDPANNSAFEKNKIYRNGHDGIYYIGTGRIAAENNRYDPGANLFKDNQLYENGLCSLNHRYGIYIGPDSMNVNQQETLIEGNEFHDNYGAEIFINGTSQKNKFGTENCSEEESKKYYNSCCPTEVAIKNNEIAGKVPIAPMGGACTLEKTKDGGVNQFIQKIISSNSIIYR
jgi:hypothetical protein